MNIASPVGLFSRHPLLMVGFTVVLCLLALTWLEMKASAIAPERHFVYTRLLHDLRELDTQIDRELLMSRQDLVRNYDALSRYMHAAQELARQLNEVPAFLSEDQRQQIAESAQRIQTTLRDKADLIDRFKRNHSLLRNSLAFFPIEAANLLDGPQASTFEVGSRMALDHYVRHVLDFSRSADDEGKQAVAEARAQLAGAALTPSQHKAVATLLRHGDAITTHLNGLERLTQQILSLQSDVLIEALDRLYGKGHAAAQALAGAYRLLLYLTAMLLAVLVAWAFMHLLRARHSLAKAHQELSARHAALLEAEKQLKLHATAFHNAHEGITLTDAQGNVLDVNPAFTRITGYSREEVIGRNPRLLKSGRQDPAFYDAMWRTIRETGHWQGEIWNRNKDGELYPELLSISAVHDAAGRLTHYVGVFIDITRLKAQENQLARMAYYDALTDLPNRALFNDRLEQGILHTRRNGKLMAVCYLDLDGFKPVNDRWGHEAGDQLLIKVAARLKSVLRGGDSVARLGGDEFALLLLGLVSVEECDRAIERLLGALAQTFQLDDGRQVELTASIGATLFPLDDSDADTLLRHADQAMYQAKQAGKNRYRFFDIEQDQLARIHHSHLAELRTALQQGGLVLHYQPKVDMRQGKVVGVEALLRWQHPQRGLLNPGEFLPFITQDALICDLGEWAIETALATMERWQESGLELPVSVNVDAHQLHQNDFLDRLKQALGRHPRVAHLLELEVLESTALADIARIARIIEECRALGVAFALDDFGTGYSSLTYLARLPARTIKIDQSFVGGMLDDGNDLILVEGIVGLARAFQRFVIAEGVENVEQGRLLMQLNCDLAQGHGIARPMSAKALPEWITHWRAPRIWQELRDLHWEPVDFPLLSAALEHRRWVDQIIRAVEGDAAMPHRFPGDVQACAFSQWFYQAQALQRYGALPAFHHIDEAHRRVHTIAAAIDGLWREGRREVAHTHLPALLAARDELLQALHELQLSVAVSH